MQVCIFEDHRYRTFLPLVYFRPVYELRSGALSLRQKIEACFTRASVTLHLREDLAQSYREENPGASVNANPKGDTWFINGRLLAGPSLAKLVGTKRQDECAYVVDGDVAAAYVKAKNIAPVVRSWGEPITAQHFDVLPTKPFAGTLIKYPWDLVSRSADEIANDFRRRPKKTKAGGRAKVYRGAELLNRKNIAIGGGSVVKPGAVLDAEHGPIILGRDVTIMPNAVIQGPAFIGDHSIVKAGAKIYHGTSVGAHCKVGGELEASIIQSYSNKQHEGFLGHSYLGSWVNIGADTNTSDLKNTYGNVRVRLGEEEIDTGLQFVGLTMGDHSKTGINMMFDTGTMAGISCNLYGPGLPPKYLPSFSWGEKNALTVYDLDKSVETARRVMARRDVKMSEVYEKLFRAVFLLTEPDRRRAGIS
jgi:UDP-N-acetylglucosamine diphosphorylase/glucosamine-1-phosphate N-acetyltransferase